MKNLFPIALVISAALFSCGQEHKSAHALVSDDKEAEHTATVGLPEIQEGGIVPKNKYIYTSHVYSDATGKRITIENSLPRGGLAYNETTRKDIYVVFWTQITNETDQPFDMQLEFPKDSMFLPSAPDNSFKIFLPSQQMNLDKVTQFDYGFLRQEEDLDDSSKDFSSLKLTVNPKEKAVFYVLVLFERGLNGVIRTGFSLKGDSLYYKVNESKIPCGTYSYKGLALIKEE